MRALVLLTPVALSLGLAPQAAYPCSQVLQLGPTQPGDGAIDVPLNAALYIHAPGIAGWGIVVEAADDAGRMSRSEAVPLGSDLARAPLELAAGRVVSLDVSTPQMGSVRHSLRLRAGSREDLTPPTPFDTPTLSIRDQGISPCTNAGWQILTVTFMPPTDDYGLAAYTLEMIREGGPQVIAHTLFGLDAADPINAVTLSASVPPNESGCYRVVAHDLAGNTTASPEVCTGAVPPPPPLDAGPPLDTGVRADAGSPVDPRQDAGPSRPDASVSRDASGPGTLETLEPECGCQSVQRSAGVEGGALSVMLALVWLARRRQPRHGSVVLGARRSAPPRAAR